LQNPQWQYTPQDTGCSGAAAHVPLPVQSVLLVHAVVGSPVQRWQSELLVHGVNVSRHTAPPLLGCSPAKLPPQGSTASIVRVPVETLLNFTANPTPETFEVESGGQSDDVPPNSGLTASTVQFWPLRGPPPHWKVSPTSGS